MKKITNFNTVLKSIYCYSKKKLDLPYMPNALWIEPTNACNLKCIMCPNSIIKNPNPGFMDIEVYKEIIDQAKDFASYVVLCISGESLLHKDFVEMVRYAKSNGLEVYLSTNATVMTSEISRNIIDAGLTWINFSFDGVLKDTYEKVRVKANFEKTLENIVNFLKIKKELNASTQTELQIIIMDDKGQKEYDENKDAFLENFKDLPLDSVQARKPSTWGSFLADTDKYVPIELEKTHGYSPCSYLWSSLHILWDGRIVACTSDFFGDNVLGKFPEQSLKEIWNGKLMKNFRQAMIDGSYLKYNKNCKDCDAIWEKRILGLPSGLRGISAITVSNIFSKKFLELAKKIAKLADSKFTMKVIKNKK